jgi:hypothetical protein
LFLHERGEACLHELKVELKDNFHAVQTLLSTLGLPILDPLATGEEEDGGEQPLLYCRGSRTAGVVLGRSSNGWREWTSGDGRSLDELERQ